MLHPWKIELHPWPFWSQLSDWTFDGQPDINRYNDCGPESVAMCLKYLTGVELPAEYVKDVMKGPGYVGYTTVEDLAGFLSKYCECSTQVLRPATAHQQAHIEWQYLRKGKPLIGLFSFSAPGASDGHFRAVIGRTRHECITADPWTGKRRVESIREHWAWSKGVLIGLERERRV